MATKTKAGINDLHLIRGQVHAPVDMFPPPDEFDDIAPAILDQITVFRMRPATRLECRTCRLFRLLNRPQAKEDDELELEATIKALIYRLDEAREGSADYKMIKR